MKNNLTRLGADREFLQGIHNPIKALKIYRLFLAALAHQTDYDMLSPLSPRHDESSGCE